MREREVGGASEDSKMEEGARSPRGGGSMGEEAVGFLFKKLAASGSRGGVRGEGRRKPKRVRLRVVQRRWCGGRLGGWWRVRAGVFIG